GGAGGGEGSGEGAGLLEGGSRGAAALEGPDALELEPPPLQPTASSAAARAAPAIARRVYRHRPGVGGIGPRSGCERRAPGPEFRDGAALRAGELSPDCHISLRSSRIGLFEIRNASVRGHVQRRTFHRRRHLAERLIARWYVVAATFAALAFFACQGQAEGAT